MEDEVLEEAGIIGINTASGPDLVPKKVLKVAVMRNTDIFVELMQKCFSAFTKKERLLLLLKVNRQKNCPLTVLLLLLEKILQRIIHDRVQCADEDLR